MAKTIPIAPAVLPAGDRDFEPGLSNLEAVAEKRAAP